MYRQNNKPKDRSYGDRHNYNYKQDDKQDHKSPLECDDKAFKSCHLRGLKSNHTFEKCYKNRKNQDKQQNYV